MTPLFSPQRLASLVSKHAPTLAKAAADKYGVDEKTMTVLPDEAFESESEPGTLCVIFQHPTGLYSVSAKVLEGDVLDHTIVNHI